ncbi:MAG: hypothetical protein CVU65_17725 [Deltaproteobacteria bacterium HGW-Deltaproteobacteria-22]|nr:MAG: hypothetical protein CVU65_17725 [Deltaproteobacteria bacterium HGW-Deltaproteobacteria-22]
MKTSQFCVGLYYGCASMLACLVLVGSTGCDFPAKKVVPYVPPAVCQEAAQLPKPVRIWIDDAHVTSHVFDDSEFVLDREGRAVTVDRQGNVVRSIRTFIHVLASGGYYPRGCSGSQGAVLWG